MGKKNWALKILSLSLVFCICLTNVAFASGGGSPQSALGSMTAEDKCFMQQFEKILGEFSFDAEGNLLLNVSYDELKTTYGFSSSQVDRVISIMDTAIELGPVLSSDESIENMPMPQIFVEDWIVYFTAEDVLDLLYSAALIGPSAIYAALIGLGSALGPLGTGLAGVVGLLGMGSLTYFTYVISQAVATNDGVYLGISWNDGWPNITQGTW